MPILKTEAIVLKTFDFRETSRIAHFFSRDYGRVNGLLKGIRKDPRKFASTLEPFSCNEIIFYQKRASDLHLVSQCDLKEGFPGIRKELGLIAGASYLIELISRLMPQEERNTQVYELVLSALKQLNLGVEPEKVLQIFIIKLLKLSGFRPRLDGCIACGRDIQGSSYFNLKRGGLLCLPCGRTDSFSQSIFPGTIASILHLEQNSWQDALRLGLSVKIKEELNRILRGFMEFHLQVRPKSQELLEVLL